ncbi:shikimate dehydrogenase family protein [Mucilaginibacter paludis]|uniref:Shikimate dehydrogenase substrate binding domain protein n=1 Tax=Mucilaginibacter paludis DSM 18603 TaxID=714943 RepID=H1Y4P1_9SPHI|nr:shikimate 5-dehydrogenase [Mucilaginibacter paludis]EHQ28085.1 Shikimate dehydrogenase substrate binding domain protein [Mucilaginibacter paludis DSM 18603]
MKQFGLIGYPLSHSFSKKYFEDKFEKEGITDHRYDLFPIEHISALSELLHQTPHLCGLNVTIPHKINVMKQLDWISHDAKEVGAVNCIRISNESPVMAAFNGEVGINGHDFRLEGFNTDIYGFEMSLKPLLTNAHTKALILGNGGAANAVKYVLEQLDISYTVVVRKPAAGAILFDDLTNEHIAEHKLIINTTPVGTSPNVHECPSIPYEFITDEHLLYDLIYNPEQSLFLTKGKENGAAIKNGYEMLVLQAEKSWEIWNSKTKHP